MGKDSAEKSSRHGQDNPHQAKRRDQTSQLKQGQCSIIIEESGRSQGSKKSDKDDGRFPPHRPLRTIRAVSFRSRRTPGNRKWKLLSPGVFHGKRSRKKRCGVSGSIEFVKLKLPPLSK